MMKAELQGGGVSRVEKWRKGHGGLGHESTVVKAREGTQMR
jgi:hypothetical protein